MNPAPVAGGPGAGEDFALWLLPVAIAVALMAFTPLAPLAFAWLALIYCRRLNRPTVSVLLAFIVLSMALTYASRRVGASPFDDFWNNYYPDYIRATQTDPGTFLLKPFEDFEMSSLEIVFPTFLALLAALPIKVNPHLLIFLITAGIGSLYVWWLNRYFLPDIPTAHRPAAGLFCILFFSFGLCSQTIRQMLSTPLLLAAIWERRRARTMGLAVLAASCHLSAAPIWAIAVLFRFTGFKTFLLLTLPMVYLLFIGFDLTGQLLGVDAGALDKLRYYTTDNQDAAGFDSTFIPAIVLVAAGSLAILKFRNGELSRLLLFFCVVFFLLLPLPLASFRATLFVTSALLAPVVCLALVRYLPTYAFSTFVGVLTLGMVMRRVLLTDESSGMAPWHLFQAITTTPFEYALRLAAGS
jgi:hypothetical protein